MATENSNISEGGVLSSGRSLVSNIHRQMERKYKIPDFQHAYTKHPRHPLTAQYIDDAHNFLASHGVDKQLGPEMWSAYVSAKSPELMAFIFVDTQPKDFLWLCKFMAFIFAIDSKMDESEYSDDPDKSCATVLGITLALLWNNPDDERLLEHLKPLNECITTDESRYLIEAFHDDLAHAKNKTKSVLDIEMTPLASAFRDLWIEYCEVVPAEFVLREGHTIQDYLMGCVREAVNRKARYEIKTFDDYVIIRRLSAAVLPYIICSDMIIARSLKIPHIPNSLFYGLEMTCLLLAINDIIGWHNDILSFYKEVILGDDGHNLVKVLCQEHNCASYTEAGEIALQLMNDRIAELERAYEHLKAVAVPKYHPAIDRYMRSCRDWISGTHQWHLISTRYNIAGTSI